ncbi:MAG: DUF4215 domain-containing protein [Polyangiaceae bacterium]|nr:DUF4215 domain-containing protein [Polyangiaceae bacterium]
MARVYRSSFGFRSPLGGCVWVLSAAAFVALPAACAEAGGGNRNLQPGTRSGTGSTTSADDDDDVSGTGATPGLDKEKVDDVDPCTKSDPPPECFIVASGPACGDGEINVDGEECDDGNSLPGDGCSGICKKEAYFECPAPGQPCVSTIVCGDGVISPGEACDDGNAVSGDGCSDKCNLVEKGFACRTAGQSCIRVYICGDSVVDPVEGCDDGNANPGDGCDPKCRLETGFKCTGNPSVCSATTCGDGVPEGAESCDDGNVLPFDGCDKTCRAEPKCEGGPCTSSCGDGIVLGEQCDDGNLRNGDGCSDKCTLEPGFQCTSNSDPCTLVNDVCTMAVPAIFRDFRAGGDFEPSAVGLYTATTGLVEKQLDAEGRPVAVGPSKDGYITSKESFAKWYRDVPGTNSTTVSEIVLWDDGNGNYVNRWGANGERWQRLSRPDAHWCGPVGQENWDEEGNKIPCTYCAWDDPATTECDNVQITECQDETTGEMLPMYDCVNDGGVWHGIYLEDEWDGNPVFFPVDGDPFTPASERVTAVIPSAYKGDWAAEPGGVKHNFHFTSEVRYWFTYHAAQTYELNFLGDDDVWVFINGRLAVDLGGIHTPVEGDLQLSGGSATVTVTSTELETNQGDNPTTTPGKETVTVQHPDLGLVDGGVYEIVVFQAERQTTASSFKLTLSGFDTAPSDCTTACGDGQIALGEECDDGAANNTGDYNKCSPNCTLGPRCGDGIKQDQYGEVCDNGVNDGAYGQCAPDCQLGPRCGDGIVQPEHEQCDDGVNAGGYGECAPGCILGAFCGDGVLTLPYEECDDGNNEDFDNCSSACRKEIILK